jgi:hypothetical protein
LEDTSVRIKAKKSFGYTYIAFPIILAVVAVISLSASGGQVYVGPGGLAIAFLFIGIWFLNNDLIIFEQGSMTIKLAPLAKKHCIDYGTISSIEHPTAKKLIIHYGSAKVKIALNFFDPADQDTITSELEAKSGKKII